MLSRLREVAECGQPTWIHWDLQTKGRVPAQFARTLKSLESSPVITRADRRQLRAAAAQHGRIRTRDRYHVSDEHRADSEVPARWVRDVRYLPEHFDATLFGQPWRRTSEPHFDVVMIASYLNVKLARLRRRYLPLQRERLALVKQLTSRFGRRFGLYGRGWEGQPSWQGVVPFREQQMPMRDSWLVLGLNNWSHADYFSNRLPISLGSGVPVVYKAFPGVEKWLVDGKHCRLYGRANQALPAIEEALRSPVEERELMGRLGRQRALDYCSMDVDARRMIAAVREVMAWRDRIDDSGHSQR